MKKLSLKIFLISTLLIGLSNVSFAQPKNEKDPQKKTLSKEEREAKRAEFQKKMTEAQIKEINKRLELDKATADKFEKLYSAYVNELNSFKKSSREDMPRKTKDISNENADKIIKKRFEKNKGIVNIQEKYYAQFKTVLSPVQIMTVYDIENEMQRKLAREHHQRLEKKDGHKKHHDKQKED